MRQKTVDRPAEIEPLTIDALIGKEFQVLDHGFVRLVDLMGSDAAVVQAARVSYGKGTKKLSEDRGLIRYLMRHHHTTPFEMCEIKLHVKLPIFVARQWVRHRTANINEYSARYSILEKEFYVPDRTYLSDLTREAREQARIQNTSSVGQDDLFGANKSSPQLSVIGSQSDTNKQGRDLDINEEEALEHLKAISGLSARAYSVYEKLLNQATDGKDFNPRFSGLARELARMVLPTNYYTQWYWKIDLHNLLHFISLRADPHAQYEIREYARIIGDIVKIWVPLTWEAFADYRQDAVSLSSLEVRLLKTILKGGTHDFLSSGLSMREWKEFCQKFDLNS